MSIENRGTDDYTRDEYNKLKEEAGIIDINTKKKEFIKEEVREFAQKTSILELSSMI